VAKTSKQTQNARQTFGIASPHSLANTALLEANLSATNLKCQVL
jgi:hypothetical protein